MNPGMSNYEAVASRDLPLSNAVSELRVAEAPTARVHDDAHVRGDRTYLRQAPTSRSLDSGPILGRVMSVDSGRLLVTSTDEGAVERASVSALVALHAGDGFLLGIIDRLHCSEDLDRVIAHIMPVGAFYPSPGGGGTFRLGTAHQPRIRASASWSKART